MNHQTTDRPQIMTGAASVDMRQRTPAEIAEQLQRDAASLEMTGASFEKDQQFYQHVAANAREAAAFLARWQKLIEDMNQRHQVERAGMQHQTLHECAGTARLVGNAQPHPCTGEARAWQNAAHAIANAIEARAASAPGAQIGGAA